MKEKERESYKAAEITSNTEKVLSDGVQTIEDIIQTALRTKEILDNSDEDIIQTALRTKEILDNSGEETDAENAAVQVVEDTERVKIQEALKGTGIIPPFVNPTQNRDNPDRVLFN